MFNRTLTFEEGKWLETVKELVMKSVGCEQVIIHTTGEGNDQFEKRFENALPGTPSSFIEVVKG